MTAASTLRDLIIGFVFLGAIGVMGLVTLSVTDVPFLGASPSEITVPFDRVDGLRVGDPVRIHGFQIGKVTAIAHRGTGEGIALSITCRFQEDFQVPPDSLFEVRSASALGGRYIEIVPGEAAPATLEAGQFRGTAKGDIFAQLGELMDEVRFGNGLIGQLIENEGIARDFAEVMREAREVVHSVNEGEGLLGALIKDGELRDRAQRIITELENTARGINEGQGILGMLVHDNERRDAVRSIIDDGAEIARAIRESRGTLGKLINDPTLHDELESALGDLRKIAADVEAGKGTLGLLLKDEEMGESLRTLVKNLDEITTTIASGEGTIGGLVKDPEVYARLNRILSEAEDALEDYREQAPISTFVNAIFSAF